MIPADGCDAHLKLLRYHVVQRRHSKFNRAAPPFQIQNSKKRQQKKTHKSRLSFRTGPALAVGDAVGQ
jgi:hypothetical protein